jgi:hypothetical protein
MGRLVGLGLHLFTAKADHTACDTVEGADLTLALGLTFDALMATQSLPRKDMPPLGRSSTRFVGTRRLFRRGRVSAACRKSQGKNHGVLNKLLREASYVRVSPLEQKRYKRRSTVQNRNHVIQSSCGRLSYFSLPKSPARISAVDDEIASGEITARIGSKIHHDGRDLARFAEAAHRREF